MGAYWKDWDGKPVKVFYHGITKEGAATLEGCNDEVIRVYEGINKNDHEAMVGNVSLSIVYIGCGESGIAFVFCPPLMISGQRVHEC